MPLGKQERTEQKCLGNQGAAGNGANQRQMPDTIVNRQSKMGSLSLRMSTPCSRSSFICPTCTPVEPLWCRQLASLEERLEEESWAFQTPCFPGEALLPPGRSGRGGWLGNPEEEEVGWAGRGFRHGEHCSWNRGDPVHPLRCSFRLSLNTHFADHLTCITVERTVHRWDP